MKAILFVITLMALFSTASDVLGLFGKKKGSKPATCETFGGECRYALRMKPKDDLAEIICPSGVCSLDLCCKENDGPTAECWDNPSFVDFVGMNCATYFEQGWCEGCSLNNYHLASEMTEKEKEDVLKNCCHGCECANREEKRCSPCFEKVRPHCDKIILNLAQGKDLPDNYSACEDCSSYFLDQCWNERNDCNIQECKDHCELKYGDSRDINYCIHACHGGIINEIQLPVWNREHRYCPVDPDTYTVCLTDCGGKGLDQTTHCNYGCKHWNQFPNVPSISFCKNLIKPEVLKNPCHCGSRRTTCEVGQWCIGGNCRNSKCGASKLRNRIVQCDPKAENWTKQIMNTCDANVCGLYVHLDNECSNMYLLKKTQVRGSNECDCKCYKRNLLCLIKSSITPISNNIQYYQAIPEDHQSMSLACAGVGFKCDKKNGNEKEKCYTECVQMIMKNDPFKNSEPFCRTTDKYAIKTNPCRETFRAITNVEECKVAVRLLGLEDQYVIDINEEEGSKWRKCFLYQNERVIFAEKYGDGRKYICAKTDKVDDADRYWEISERYGGWPSDFQNERKWTITRKGHNEPICRTGHTLCRFPVGTYIVKCKNTNKRVNGWHGLKLFVNGVEKCKNFGSRSKTTSDIVYEQKEEMVVGTQVGH